MEPLSRRQFLATSAGAALAVGCEGLLSVAWGATAERRAAAAGEGELLRLLPFLGEGSVRTGEATGSGLGGRLYHDLGTMEAGKLLTPAGRFFVRTRRPEYLEGPGSLVLAVRPPGVSPFEMHRRELEALARPMGVHLLECIENGRENGFGLVSAGEWTGVPLAALFERTGTPADVPWLLLVEGFDRHAGSSPGSGPGANWIFSPADLEATGAFLATGLSGAPLADDHGFPLRLVVPGRYGCAWIKWVTNVIFLQEDALPTPHMAEFARRTGQKGRPKLARQYQPAALEHAALPVRVEERRVEGGRVFRVVGLLWGGSRPAQGLSIRFRPEDPWVPVEGFGGQESTATWTLWSHPWRPPGPGRYAIDLKVEPAALPARRLAAGHYRRMVEVTEG